MTTGRNFAIDIGSGFVKFFDSDGAAKSFPSLVADERPEYREIFGYENAETIRFGDSDMVFLVGGSVRSYGDPEVRYNTTCRNWTGSDPWMALLYAAFANAGFEEDVTISRFATGIPQGYYTDAGLKKRVVARLKGEHNFKYCGQSRKVVIEDVFLIPQAVGAVFHLLEANDEIDDDAIGIIDVGTYTTGFAVVDGIDIINRQSGGVEVGISNLVDALVEHLQVEYGYRTDVVRMQQILQTGQIRRRGEIMDISTDIERIAIRVFDPALTWLTRNWGAANDLLVYAAGGGGRMFLPAIQQRVPHTEMMDNAFHAVVNGMMIYLKNR